MTIISASRRTDVPAFYSTWFNNRVQAGYCTVPNPFNSKQITRVSLKPEDVDVLAFWTRNPVPMMRYLPELDRRGYQYYFHYSLLGYPRSIDKFCPSMDQSICSFIKLAELVGPDRVIWRYDPIVLTSHTGVAYHLNRFEYIAGKLRGWTSRCVVSIADVYRKNSKRLAQIADVARIRSPEKVQLDALLEGIADLAFVNGIKVTSCAEKKINLARYGISPGKCIDDSYLKDVFKLEMPAKKDPGQRKSCSCIVSKDIGMYDSCLFGCRYCYATGGYEKVLENFKRHDPRSPSLLGYYEVEIKMLRQKDILTHSKIGDGIAESH